MFDFFPFWMSEHICGFFFWKTTPRNLLTGSETSSEVTTRGWTDIVIPVAVSGLAANLFGVEVILIVQACPEEGVVFQQCSRLGYGTSARTTNPTAPVHGVATLLQIVYYAHEIKCRQRFADSEIKTTRTARQQQKTLQQCLLEFCSNI